MRSAMVMRAHISLWMLGFFRNAMRYTLLLHSPRWTAHVFTMPVASWECVWGGGAQHTA